MSFSQILRIHIKVQFVKVLFYKSLFFFENNTFSKKIRLTKRSQKPIKNLNKLFDKNILQKSHC